MNLDHHDLLARFGLKWNPFSSEVPVSALWQPAFSNNSAGACRSRSARAGLP